MLVTRYLVTPYSNLKVIYRVNISKPVIRLKLLFQVTVRYYCITQAECSIFLSFSLVKISFSFILPSVTLLSTDLRSVRAAVMKPRGISSSRDLVIMARKEDESTVFNFFSSHLLVV